MPVVRRQVLTKLLVDGIKPKSTPFRVWDAKVPGLALRVRPTGRKTYELHWGRNKATVLGIHGAMTLEGARSAALRALGETEQHGAPLATVEGGLGKASTFGEFLTKRYGPHLLAVNKAGAETVAAINAQFDHLAGRQLATITRADFDEFKARRLNAGTHPATVNRDMDRLKAALSQAVEWELLAENPLRGLKRIKRGIEERVRYLSTKEELALRRALEKREKRFQSRRSSGNEWRAARGKPALQTPAGYSDHLMPMVLLALNTGLRRGELTALNWEDINLAAKVLTVRATSAKSGKARHVPLNTEAMVVLRTWRKRRAVGRLFELASATKSWSALMGNAKIVDFRFHDLRHTFASKLVMAGVDLNTVRELLGHSDIKMTLRYAHLAPEHKAAAVQALVRSKR